MNEPNLILTESLIRLKTIPEHPEDLRKSLELVEQELAGFTIERFTCDGVESILVHNQETRPEKFKLILNAHLDIIPGNESQYEPKREGDKLIGVGAMDMKANLVCAIEAFKKLANQVSYPLALQLVTDEEIGGFKGTKYQVEQGVNAEFVLSTEPTNFDIVHEAKGVLWLNITATGETAHGAYPWRGKNAVETVLDVAEKIRGIVVNPTEQQWCSTLNIAGIDTPNTAHNKVPDSCTLRLDIRFVPGDEERILKGIQAILLASCTLEVLANEPALDTPKDNPFVTTLAAVTQGVIGREAVLRGAQGSSDARHFRHVDTDGIEFGPVGDGIGADDEWVSIESLGQFQEILERFITELDRQ